MQINIKLEDLCDIFYPIITMDKDFNFNKLVEYNNQLIDSIDNDSKHINDSYYYKLGVYVYHRLKSILNKLDNDYIWNQSQVLKQSIWLFYNAEYSNNDLIDIGKTAEWCIKNNQY